MRLRSFSMLAALAVGFLLPGAGCSREHRSAPAEYKLGEQIPLGALTYNVIETSWASQLGAMPMARLPERSFLLVHLSITNGGGQKASIPFLSLVNRGGERFPESENGQGVDNWLGVLREIKPAETEEGWILFDVPQNSYRLQLVDNDDAGGERAAYVDLPLRLQ
jgi:hypothetical protein